MYVAGTTFFLATFSFDRNIAGRTAASFRLADVLVMVMVISASLRRPSRDVSSAVAVGVAIVFVILKSYVTMATVGFFDE
jgi:hypothetical protein